MCHSSFVLYASSPANAGPPPIKAPQGFISLFSKRIKKQAPTKLELVNFAKI